MAAVGCYILTLFSSFGLSSVRIRRVRGLAMIDLSEDNKEDSTSFNQEYKRTQMRNEMN